MGKSNEEVNRLGRDIVDLHGEMVLLENYSALNYTGIHSEYELTSSTNYQIQTCGVVDELEVSGMSPDIERKLLVTTQIYDIIAYSFCFKSIAIGT